MAGTPVKVRNIIANLEDRQWAKKTSIEYTSREHTSHNAIHKAKTLLINLANFYLPVFNTLEPEPFLEKQGKYRLIDRPRTVCQSLSYIHVVDGEG